MRSSLKKEMRVSLICILAMAASILAYKYWTLPQQEAMLIEMSHGAQNAHK